MFKARNKPFVLVFWSRDPDGTPAQSGRQPQQLTPGINGPTSLAAIKNADDNLAALRQALDELGLAATTDIIVSADHGFSTISKESKTSPAAKAELRRRPEGAAAARISRDRSRQGAGPAAVRSRQQERARSPAMLIPRRGNGLIGNDPAKPDVVVAANGGSDLVYLPGKDREAGGARWSRRCWRRITSAACSSTTTLGRFPGTLPMSAINLKGAATHAASGDRGQLPLVRHRLRQAGAVRGRVADTGLAAGPGHARQLQPRRHHEFHGGDRARLQSRLRQRSAGQQCRHRQDHRPYPRSERPVQGPLGRPRHQKRRCRADAAPRCSVAARVASQASANGLVTVLDDQRSAARAISTPPDFPAAPSALTRKQGRQPLTPIGRHSTANHFSCR